MSNKVTLTFAGDAGPLQKESKKAADAIEDVGASTNETASDLEAGGKSSQGFTDKIGKLGAGVTGMTDAIDSAGAAVQGLADFQAAGRERAQRLARAQADVEQAELDASQAAIDLKQSTVDLSQAQADGRQAGIDMEQAMIDQKQATVDIDTAQKAYNDAVKKHGANSAEAKQADVDLRQARLDGKQATEDYKQAQIDANQSTVDAQQYTNDAAQAVRDGKDAQLDLNDAMSEANPSGLQQWADKIGLITPLLSGLVGVMGLVTAAQWAWNAAQAASPTTWIVLAIVALIAVIVLIATKTEWFQKAWRNTWNGIKTAASAVGRWFRDTLWPWIGNVWDKISDKAKSFWNWIKGLPKRLKDAFSGVGSFITAPFRAAFNAVSSAWNNTVGRLSFSVPGWVPGIGGNSFSAPTLPHFHSGGTIPGTPGSETIAVLQAGERVIPRGGNDANAVPGVVPIGSDGSRLGDLLIELIQQSMAQKRAGDPRALGLRI